MLFCCIWSFVAAGPEPHRDAGATQQAGRDTSGQRDLIGSVFAGLSYSPKEAAERTGRRVYYSLVPLEYSVPGGGNALITSTTAGFYLGDRKTTYSVQCHLFSRYQFQRGIQSADPVEYLGGEKCLELRGRLPGDGFIRSIPGGLGGNTAPSHKILMRYTYVRLYQNRLKTDQTLSVCGIGYDMDWHINIRPDIDTLSLTKFTGYSNGTANRSNSFSSGLTLNLLYDTRNNSLNPLPGWFYDIILRINPKSWGARTIGHPFTWTCGSISVLMKIIRIRWRSGLTSGPLWGRIRPIWTCRPSAGMLISDRGGDFIQADIRADRFLT